MAGIFELKNASDLLGKLRYEYEQLRQESTNQYVAFNFFVTAEHLLDWLYPGRSNLKKREEVRNSERLLQICSHIASGAKHFEVEAKHHQAVSNSHKVGHWPRGYFPEGYWPKGHWPEWLVIRLKGDAAKEFGQSIEVLELADKVMAFWGSHLELKEANRKS